MRGLWRHPATLSQALMLTVFVGLLPLLVASFFQASASWRDTQALADAQLAATARAIAERERDPFLIARHSLMTVSALPDVKDMTAGCDEDLAAGRTNDKTLNNFVRADENGTVRCSILPFSPGTTLAGDSWWRDGIARGGLSITQPVIGRVARKPVIILMLAMSQADGSSAGSVSAGVEIGNIQRSIKKEQAGSTGYIAVLDKQGQPFAENRALNLGAIDLKATSGVASSSDGGKWAYAIAPLFGSGDLSIIYAEPQKQLMSVALSNIRYSIFFPLLAIMFACGAIWMGSDFFVLRWLRKLQASTAQFARGNYDTGGHSFAAAPIEVREAANELFAMAAAVRARDADLNASLNAQKQLTREIHHRVKNNLQIITSLLTLQAGRLQDPAAREALGQTRARASALGLIYRLLYDHGANPELGEVALDSLIGELCAQLRSSHHSRPEINVHCSAVKQTISIDQAVPLTLLTVEAVTNSYRHAFADGASGDIFLKLENCGDRIRFSVRDTGIGYDPAIVAGQMGSDLMQAFAVQLGGELLIDSAAGQGTSVSVTFKPA